MLIDCTCSGKSSLILTLLRLLDQSGSVVVDNINTSDITRQHLRSRITVIAQDPVELPGSVRYNLIPFHVLAVSFQNNTLKETSIQEILSKVGLWEHVSTKGGLDADFSALGLSQGQRQLFCLSRAILHHEIMESKILLVDEATSNIDIDTERKIQAVMRAAFLECTVITVAHRLETLQGVDVVLELEKGGLSKRKMPEGSEIAF